MIKQSTIDNLKQQIKDRDKTIKLLEAVIKEMWKRWEIKDYPKLVKCLECNGINEVKKIDKCPKCKVNWKKTKRYQVSK